MGGSARAWPGARGCERAGVFESARVRVRVGVGGLACPCARPRGRERGRRGQVWTLRALLRFRTRQAAPGGRGGGREGGGGGGRGGGGGPETGTAGGESPAPAGKEPRTRLLEGRGAREGPEGRRGGQRRESVGGGAAGVRAAPNSGSLLARSDVFPASVKTVTNIENGKSENGCDTRRL